MVLPVYQARIKNQLATLRAVSKDVTKFDESLRVLCKSLVETMFASNGVGLAAPQIGQNLNVFVMRTVEGIAKDTDEHIVIINPHTIITANEPEYALEGCLSLPGLLGKVLRYRDVGCVYYDADGQRHAGNFTGFQARIYQHEHDHLRGTLFIDRAEALYKPKEKEEVT